MRAQGCVQMRKQAQGIERPPNLFNPSCTSVTETPYEYNKHYDCFVNFDQAIQKKLKKLSYMAKLIPIWPIIVTSS